MYKIESVDDDFATCLNEQHFKKLYIATRMKKEKSNQKIFCIETEETVAGFPDVMETYTISAGSCTQAFFYEFKISDKGGSIKFQPTQPAFYKKNSELPIEVVAYNRQSKRVHVFSTNELFNRESPYYIKRQNGVYARIDLTLVEKELGI